MQQRIVSPLLMLPTSFYPPPRQRHGASCTERQIRSSARFGLAWHDLTFRFVPLLPFPSLSTIGCIICLWQVDLKHEARVTR